MFNLNIDLLKPVLNGTLMVVGQYGSDVLMGGYGGIDKSRAKELGIDFAVMASATLINELIANTVALPSFLNSLKNVYGVDLLTVIMFVAFKFMFDRNSKSGLIKEAIVSIGVVLASNYVETPLRPYAPSWLLPKV